MKNSSLTFLSFLFLSLITGACADRQDFDQYNNLQLTPAVEASMLYVESTESFINDSSPGMYYSEEFNFDAFAETFVSENVLDGVITYELENTTSKDLELLVEFLDEAGNVLDTELFTIEAAPTGVLRREVAYGGPSGRSIDIIRNTSGFRLTGRNLGDNSSISSLPDPKAIFRSSAKIRIELQ